MACSGVFCQDYGTGTTTCNQHRGSCATNRQISPTGDFGVQGGRIRSSDIDTLRSSIMDEIDRWNLWRSANGQAAYTKSDPGGLGSGVVIDNSHINGLNSTLANISNPGISKADGNLIEDTDWTTIYGTYNTVRQDCICNSDCSCNAVCSCHNNCGCNYSDERLKENIKFVEEKNGLRIYSWNYLWDKATRHIGVMAQEVLKTKYANAVKQDRNGFYMVNYKQLPI